jgi:transcriptional regulator with XRE-family HTH domain
MMGVLESLMKVQPRRFFESEAYMTELLNTTGKRVERLRRDHGWTQVELARAAQVRQGYISIIEKDNGAPSAALMAAIARALETTLDFLMMLTNDPRTPKDAEPTYLSKEAEETAKMVDEMYPDFRAKALLAVRTLYEHHLEHAQRNKQIEELLAVIEAAKGVEGRRDAERQAGLRRGPGKVSGESLPGHSLGDIP